MEYLYQPNLQFLAKSPHLGEGGPFKDRLPPTSSIFEYFEVITGSAFQTFMILLEDLALSASFRLPWT